MDKRNMTSNNQIASKQIISDIIGQVIYGDLTESLGRSPLRLGITSKRDPGREQVIEEHNQGAAYTLTDQMILKMRVLLLKWTGRIHQNAILESEGKWNDKKKSKKCKKGPRKKQNKINL